ncbi:MAG: MGMT family protein [Lachnospiraceae bacterium]|jgi:methylated-DNA-protein-cysteine methyltransferase-like protein|nr:MGMT family protein [Lachnospiraceae bacterium]
MKQEQIKTKVYAVVNDIPEGYVLTYGIVAALAGAPGNARLIARMMTHSNGEINNHRIVNSAGRIAPGWDSQRTLLESEGVVFKENGNVDMKRHLWQPLF